MTSRRGMLWLVAIVVGSCSAWAQDAATPVRYDDFQVVRTYPTTWGEIEQMRDLGLRLLSDGEAPGLVDYLVPPEAMEGFRALGINHVVLNKDLQKSIDAERARLTQRQPADPRSRAWYDDFKTFDEIVAKLNTMVADRPDIASLIDIGDSIEGRDIWALRISGPGTDKPAILYNGTQHAREWIAPMVNMYIADALVYGYGSDLEITSLVDRVEIFIIPVVNPDGYVYSWTTDRMWRKNRRDNLGTSCDGVDPNRNWDAAWSAPGASGDPCDETYYGTAPFSEPETAAMRDFYYAHPNIVSNIDYHSYSQLILSPYGYTTALPADNDIFLELGEAMHDEILAVHGVSYDWGPIISTIGYQASGGSVDWCYDDQGVFSFTIELRPASAWPGFELPPEEIIPTCEENLPAAFYLAEWSSTPVQFSFPNGLPARLTPDTPTVVLVEVDEIGATIDSASLRLFSRVGTAGGFTESTLANLGGSQYEATLPATGCGRTLQYYFYGQTTGGQDVVSPADAPAALYAAESVLVDTAFEDDFEADMGWTVSGDAADGHWERGVPADWGRGDPPADSDGSGQCYLTDNDLFSDNSDVDNGTTILMSPAIDMTEGATISYAYWLNDIPGGPLGAEDAMTIEVATNAAGTNWVELRSYGTPASNWRMDEIEVGVEVPASATVRVRFMARDLDPQNVVEAGVDDFQVIKVLECPFDVGDLNCDGMINSFDIDPFVLALSDATAYSAAYPDCDVSLADANGDGLVNSFDIDAFVTLLTGP